MLAEGEDALGALNERERHTAEAGRNLHRIRNVVLLAAEFERYEAIINQVQQKQKEAERLSEQIGRMAATATAITAIERAEVELSAATAALNASATLIGMSHPRGRSRARYLRRRSYYHRCRDL